MHRSTLKSSVFFEGIGVHSGNHCRVSVSPAKKGNGIVFSIGKDSIRASFDRISDTIMCTKLSSVNGSVVSTVEHLAAALYGLEITDVKIKVEGGEVPILDGSAIQFVEAFTSAGIEKFHDIIQTLRIKKTIKIQDEERWTSLSPADSFSINIECDFMAKGLKTDPFSFDFAKDDFTEEIAPARTFGFFSDIEFLRKNNLAAGASLDNTIVFDNKGLPINKEGLRLSNEPLRHKVLDIIGDLSMTGSRIIARFDSFCPSHRMNNMILKALFADKDSFELVD
ncbi:MAG: UDP-3-O-acyl-N-acetylglucosamine deacetylase [Holosporaceae bacterium]|nr:UDP-3-O-acyl-N-acetylglucosamine deacetylase [Holosporaceae bacterium]